MTKRTVKCLSAGVIAISLVMNSMQRQCPMERLK